MAGQWSGGFQGEVRVTAGSAGASTTFGFLGSWAGSNGVPALTCSAG